MSQRFDFVIIGGGIIGLATGMALLNRQPKAKLLLLEKENRLAAHQTGRNSGVIHSGIYYKPGSLKAQLCKSGNAAIIDFCRVHDIDHEVCGKVIAATRDEEIPRLENLYQRGIENGLAIEKLSPEQAREIEPHLQCVAALRVPSTGICDYKSVCEKLAQIIQESGGEIQLNAGVLGIQKVVGGYAIETSNGVFETKFLINCGGLHCDRISRLAGAQAEVKIVPFRGEYFELKPEKRFLVKHLIYPVPDPAFPFLGVHFTRMIDGNIHCGPNAVLALRREGYRKTDFNFRDAWETLTYSGFAKLALRYPRVGASEILRSFNKSVFTRSLQTLIPEVRADDLVPSASGVRAQALHADGRLEDDFLLLRDEHALHVLNAPSPAATASLEIGKTIAAQVLN